MKVLFCVLMICFLSVTGIAQNLRIPVGLDSILFSPPTDTTYSYCFPNGVKVEDTCIVGFTEGYPTSFKEFYFAASTAFDSTLNYLGFHSDTAGIFIDTFSYVSTPYNANHPCSGCNDKGNKVISTVDCYYDSLVHIPYALWMFFGLKKDSMGYLPCTNGISIYNNTSEQISCEAWSLEVDPQYKIKIISIADSSSKVNPFSKAVPSFSIESSVPSFFNFQKAYGKLKVSIHSKFIDSIFVIPVRFFFYPAKVSSVNQQEDILLSLLVYPNPSIVSSHIFVTLRKSSLFHLHIFNELGKDIMTVYDGILPEGKRDFSFKLPQGMYYVRMETAEGVVTKKVVVN